MGQRGRGLGVVLIMRVSSAGMGVFNRMVCATFQSPTQPAVAIFKRGDIFLCSKKSQTNAAKYAKTASDTMIFSEDDALEFAHVLIEFAITDRRKAFVISGVNSSGELFFIAAQIREPNPNPAPIPKKPITTFSELEIFVMNRPLSYKTIDGCIFNRVSQERSSNCIISLVTASPN